MNLDCDVNLPIKKVCRDHRLRVNAESYALLATVTTLSELLFVIGFQFAADADVDLNSFAVG
jgi:hypothetical protein